MLDDEVRAGLNEIAGRCRKLRIAVTGHRTNRLSDTDRERVLTGFEELFAQVRSRAPERTIVECGLAGGTDIAAAWACPSTWVLNGLLAMPEPDWIEYLEQENPAEVELFRRLTIMDHVNLTVLPAPWPNYGALASRLATNSDLLLAVWDGLPGPAGGTFDVVQQTLAAGSPVFALDPFGRAGWHQLPVSPDNRAQPIRR